MSTKLAQTEALAQKLSDKLRKKISSQKEAQARFAMCLFLGELRALLWVGDFSETIRDVTSWHELKEKVAKLQGDLDTSQALVAKLKGDLDTSQALLDMLLKCRDVTSWHEWLILTASRRTSQSWRGTSATTRRCWTCF